MGLRLSGPGRAPIPDEASEPSQRGPASEPAATAARKPTLPFKEIFLGKPRNLDDPHVFHNVSLIAFLAWVGLGADGLSSSAYGPDAAFRALGEHTYLAVALALATAFTVFVISYAYSRIVEHFPFGGGGYAVATKLLGDRFGVVSGSALLVDYVLTITTLIAGGADALWSFLPPHWVRFKLAAEFAAIGILVLMNLRGVRESVTILAPIFLLFLVTHAVMLAWAIGTRVGEAPAVAHQVQAGFHEGLATLGLGGMFALFLRAYSLGGGTYTGIEAVSNGLTIMREPKVETAKRTMAYMAASLAITAGGILFCYLLVYATPVEGKTMNAVLLERVSGGWSLGGIAFGKAFVIVSLLAEGALLFVAAQAGFIDGPRVMANMATDSWLPHRFSSLSERLTMQEGVLLMGTASLATLLYTHGDITALVTMYSINVFLTFSLSQMGMVRFWVTGRKEHPDWQRHIAIHIIGLILCLSILAVTVYEKAAEGGWITLVVTGIVVGLCQIIRSHYAAVRESLGRLDEVLGNIPLLQPAPVAPPIERTAPTAAILVSGYSGMGVHSLLNLQAVFPGHFRNFVFLCVGVIDSATFRGQEEVERVREQTREALDRYVALCTGLGLAATSRMAIGTEPVQTATDLCLEVANEFSRVVFFAGKLVFQRERWYQRLLHNETAYSIQRRLQFGGKQMMVLPIRVLKEAA